MDLRRGRELVKELSVGRRHLEPGNWVRWLSPGARREKGSAEHRSLTVYTDGSGNGREAAWKNQDGARTQRPREPWPLGLRSHW